MTLLAEFALESGIALGLAVVMAAAVFRSANVSTGFKVIIPSMLLAFAIDAPWKVNALLGTPQHVACSNLPKLFDLIAFAPDDDDKVADLVVQAGGPLHTYEVDVSSEMMSALADIRPKLARGPVRIKRHCGDQNTMNHKGQDAPTEAGEKVFETVAPPKKGADE